MSSVRSAGKMKLLCLVYLIFLSIALTKAENSSLIVKVSVYYETLCPDSINFVRNQLDPNYNAFGKEYIQLELIPYGFAKEKHINGKTIFTCQHGADECYGNKVHGCVFHLESIDKSEAFLTCSEKAPLPASTTTLKNQAIPVTIYYESLCYDSVHFITRELYPNYQHFKKYLTIEFVPYGKALHSFNSSTGKYSFVCQHGKQECLGNKFQACGLAETQDQDIKLDFVTCVMSANDPANIYYIEECARKYNLDFTNITNCAISAQGDELLASHGNKTWTLEPNLYYVPTVVFNNSIRINENDQRQSLENFKKFMCKKIATNLPEVCSLHEGVFEKIKNFFT